MAVMIHVAAQPEPASFDEEVRQKGLAWLRKKKITFDQALPSKTTIEPYWRHCLDEMHESYNGCCAYLAIFFERVTGGGSVDHFIAKSRRADLAYEWSNYRLASSRMNSRKREYDDVLDPFEVKNGWFQLEPVSGRIYPNPQLPNK
jgi:5-methylcytosine-specific restriction endonuclease McrA